MFWKSSKDFYNPSNCQQQEMMEILKYYMIINRFNKRHDICDKEPKKLEFSH
jgi:hypothetical protein